MDCCISSGRTVALPEPDHFVGYVSLQEVMDLVRNETVLQTQSAISPLPLLIHQSLFTKSTYVPAQRISLDIQQAIGPVGTIGALMNRVQQPRARRLSWDSTPG